MRVLVILSLITFHLSLHGQVSISEPIAEIVSSSNVADYDFGSFTPTAGALLVCIAGAKGTTGVGSMLNVSGTSLTWTTEKTQTFSGGASVYMMWAKVPASPSASVYRVNTGADPATGCIAYMWSITNYDAHTLNPIRQSASGSATSTNATCTFGQAMNTGNGYVAAWFGSLSSSNPANVSTSPSSGAWTEVGDNGFGTPTTNGSGAYRVGSETGTTVTFGGASTDWGVIAAEIYVTGGGPKGFFQIMQ